MEEKAIRFLGTITALFFVLLIIELYGEATRNHAVISSVKPLLMPVLLILFLLNTQTAFLMERICFTIALIISCIGDILFIEVRDDVFIAGLVAFLLTHVAYIVSFLARDEQREHVILSTNFISFLPFLTYFSIVLYILYPTLNESSQNSNHFLLPVIVYGCVIIGMSYVAYLRDHKLPGYWLVFLGAIIFILSDTLLAFNFFIAPIPLQGFCIMLVYGIGQYLITVGFIKSTTKVLKNN